MNRVIVLAGLSGSGKSTALNVLEDLGYAVVQNLPAELGEAWLEWARREFPDRSLAIGLHLPSTPQAFPSWVREHRALAVCLEANDQVLVRRFSETRRRHPWSTNWETLVETLAHERSCLEPYREHCDHHVDTTSMRASELREFFLETFAVGEHRVQLNVVTFGFKRGVPPYVDLCVDVRFLPNPYWDLALRPLTGHDQAVADTVLANPQAKRWLGEQIDSVHWQYEAFVKAGKSYLTIGVGCTGGRHRSVAMALALADGLRQRGLAVNLRHRETPAPQTSD
jgi:UPF0042 nucleotide-binding protein